MAQFDFENQIKSLTRFDIPLKNKAAAGLRYQRKATETSGNMSCNMSKLNASLSQSMSMNNTAKTPNKQASSEQTSSKSTRKTPAKTPKKSPGITGAGVNKTPGGDRYIPTRSNSQYDVAHYLVVQDAKGEKNGAQNISPSKVEYQRIMSENLNGGDIDKVKILIHEVKPPEAPEGFQNYQKVLFNHSKTPGVGRKNQRYIPQQPERILDAPELMDDYYLNLLDWSVHNHLAVALTSQVYIWNAGSGEIAQLMELQGEDYVCSVSWTKDGLYLAIGLSTGAVELWDASAVKRLRSMGGHGGRVGSLSWNEHIVSSGSRTGHIHHHDVRVPQHHIATLACHTQEVGGLKWSTDGRHLASGGNDNLLNIWPGMSGHAGMETQPLYSLTQHQAAVKGLAWCPWQPSLLASGAGMADRHIRLWNSSTGECMNAIDTQSQVCSLIWSTEYKELVSSHGYPANQLVIWKYPTMEKVAELKGHTARVLHMAVSPDGATVVSGAADETLRLWKCFATDPIKKKKLGEAATSDKPSALMMTRIR